MVLKESALEPRAEFRKFTASLLTPTIRSAKARIASATNIRKYILSIGYRSKKFFKYLENATPESYLKVIFFALPPEAWEGPAPPFSIHNGPDGFPCLQFVYNILVKGQSISILDFFFGPGLGGAPWPRPKNSIRSGPPWRISKFRLSCANTGIWTGKTYSPLGVTGTRKSEGAGIKMRPVWDLRWTTTASSSPRPSEAFRTRPRCCTCLSVWDPERIL